VEREVRVWGREEPRGTGKFSEIIFRASPSPPLGVSPGEEESSASAGLSMKRREAS